MAGAGRGRRVPAPPGLWATGADGGGGAMGSCERNPWASGVRANLLGGGHVRAMPSGVGTVGKQDGAK